MICGLQLLAFAVGVYFMLATVVRLGNFEIRRPATFFVGVILFMQAPMALLVGSAVGAAEGLRAAQGMKEFDPKKFQEKWGWIDLAITGGSIAFATLLALSQMREPELEERIEEVEVENVVGVRDYVREQKERDQEAQRHHREWDVDQYADENYDQILSCRRQDGLEDKFGK